MKQVMPLILVIVAALCALAATSSVGEAQSKARSGPAPENVYMKDSGQGTDCLKSKITKVICAYEGEVVQWNLTHDCSSARDVEIIFEAGPKPCEESQSQLKRNMPTNSKDFIQCTIAKGMGGTASSPKKYPYVMRGPKNESDPEIDVPPPTFRFGELLLAVVFILELVFGVFLVVQFNRLKRARVESPRN
jgi:hypothetical protein